MAIQVAEGKKDMKVELRGISEHYSYVSHIHYYLVTENVTN